jgi:hypothetical protein
VSVLDAWTDEVIASLDLDADGFDRDLLLDLTRDVAHGVARPAAPLTAYLVGLAVGGAGGSRAALEDAVRRVTDLVTSREAEPPDPAVR